MGKGQRRNQRGTISAAFARWLLAVSGLLIAGAVWAQGGPVGALDHVAGSVFVQTGGGELRRAEKGTPVANGDTVSTDAGAYANIRFVDGAQVFLRPNARVLIEAYVYEKDRAERDSFVYRLLKGSLRAITGQIGSRGKPEAYRLNTAIATIGIRGTTLDAALCEGGSCPGQPDGLRTDAVVDPHHVTNETPGRTNVSQGDGSYTKDATTPTELVKGGNGLGKGDPPLSSTALSQQQEEKTETIEETQANIARGAKEQAGISQRSDDRLEKLERDNQPQRSAYQGKVETFAQGTKPPPGTTASPPSYDAAEGRYTGATITYTDGAGKITHAARFDADGNTKGIEQTPLGKILQTISPVLQALTKETGSATLDRDFDSGLGGNFISSVTIYDGNGATRGVYRFNEAGVPYSTMVLGPDGKTIVNAGFDPGAVPVIKDPGGLLSMVTPQQFVTGVCAPCQAIANRINNLADEMNGLMEPINARARSHSVASVSGQLGTRAEHTYLLARWNGYKAQYDSELQRLAKECQQPCAPPARTTSLVGRPIAMCTIETASAAAAEAVAKGAGATTGLVTTLPTGRVEAEIRVQTSNDPKAPDACGNLNPGPGGTLIERVPCGEMAQPVTPYARSVARNPIEAKVAAGADFSQTTVVSGGANPGSPQGFVNNARPGWSADAAGGPNVQRGPTGGSFQLPTLPSGPRQPSLTESLNVGSLSTVDFDRVQKGVKTGQAALTFATKIEELKYKLDNGLPIKPEEVLGLSKELNTLRGSRFKKLGPLLDGITKGLAQKKELAQNLAKAQEILDFLNTADRARDDPIAAAEALSKYLNLVSAIAGKVPGMGEFVTMYAKGVEGMLDGLRVMQKRHDLTVETMRDINDFTKDFYGELEQAPTAADVPAAEPPRDLKAEADAENVYRGTRAEAGRLQDATSALRSTERCIDNCLAQLGALQNRLRDLDENQRRMGNEAGLRAQASDMAADKLWYDNYVAKNGKAATPTNKADFERWSRARSITERQVVEARERIGSARALDAERSRIRAEMDKLAQRLAECEKRQVGEQREYLQALRAYVEKTTFLEELAATGDAAQAQTKAAAARDRIPTEPPPVRYRIAAEPSTQVSLAPARIVTVCEDTAVGGPVTPTISVPYDPSAVGRTRTR